MFDRKAQGGEKVLSIGPVWIGRFLGEMVSGSSSADSEEKFGPCGTMALPVFGSAEEVNRAAE